MRFVDNDVRWLGILTCHQLNELHGTPCCPRCCAPCDAVRQMVHTRSLNRIIRQAPTYLYENVDWYRNGTVDEDWLFSRWGCRDQPPCYIPTPGVNA